MNDRLRRWMTSLEAMFQNDYWDRSMVGRVFRKKFQDWYNAVVKLEKAESFIKKDKPIRKHQQVVYVSLHAVNGHHLAHWHEVMHAFPYCGMGRPVYDEETKVIRAVSRKNNIISEGYVALLVAKKDVISQISTQIPHDVWGQSLLQLKQEAFRTGEIYYFVHANDQKYSWESGRLKGIEKIECLMD